MSAAKEKLSTFDYFENAPAPAPWPLAPLHVPLPETQLMNWTVDGKKFESQESCANMILDHSVQFLIIWNRMFDLSLPSFKRR